ncbi:threonylcarbamoyladenosine tRNA methylthiotransferase isoform X1 [Tachypleus tridentatus]|uniref:threonylcarbamoyladenosine tRNA methylthiotransferase isoform X1 n=2 Tax=Tachypleus tridentatus TaxID=6853 RepID=UPI003FD3DB5E
MVESCNADIDDIEDLGQISCGSVEVITSRRDHLVPRVRKKKRENLSFQEQKVVAESFIPGTQSIYVKTWGCAHNNSDSEYMAGILAFSGYKVIDDPAVADLWLLNSCTVKGPAEDHFRNAVMSGLERGKHVVVAGCVPQAAPRASYLKGLSVVGVQQIDRVVEVVEETLKGHTVRLFGSKKEGGHKYGGASLALPKIRKNPLIEIIPINTGCLNQCTYCKTKHARGELGSYSIEEIVTRAKQAFHEGVREIWLTSEDTGAYGRDIGVTLPQLLYRLEEVIPEGCMLRLGMTNPPYILEYLEDIAKIMASPRVYAFLHVPVQSGSDAVLADMKREYCGADFRHVVDFLRDRVPEITIATDVICGFPTETEKDFEETIKLVQDYKFPSLFINQFYPRPGTPAARLPRVPAQEVKQRTKRITEEFKSHQPYKQRVGKCYTVLVTELSHDKQHYVGHNKSYEQVLVPKEDWYLGQMVDVQIKEVGKHFMVGVPLNVTSWMKQHLPSPLPVPHVSGNLIVNDHQVKTAPDMDTDYRCGEYMQLLAARYSYLPTIWLTVCVTVLVLSVVVRLHGIFW